VIPLYTVPPLDGMQDVLRHLGWSATLAQVTVSDDLSNLDEAKRLITVEGVVLVGASRAG